MRLDQSTLDGLRRAFAKSDGAIWVYENDEREIELFACHEDVLPPRWHRDHIGYLRVGRLDLATGRVVRLGLSDGHREADEADDEAVAEQPPRGQLQIVYLLKFGVKAFLALVMMGFLLMLALASGMSRSGRGSGPGH
jgi:hypothetical protein